MAKVTGGATAKRRSRQTAVLWRQTSLDMDALVDRLLELKLYALQSEKLRQVLSGPILLMRASSMWLRHIC